MDLRTCTPIALLGALLLVAPASNATLILNVSEEIQTGGITSNVSVDEDSLSANLTNGRGSASLAALRSFNRDTTGFDASYTNRSSWELSNLLFTADTPGTDLATVGIGGRLTATLSGSLTSGGFSGALSAVKVEYSFVYTDSGIQQLGGGELFFRSQRTGGFLDPLEASADIDEFVGTVLTFPVDVPVTLSMTLSTVANLSTTPGVSGQATADAANSLTFDTSQFFDIQTAGVTANAGGFIVDNTVPAFAATALPLPGSLGLLGAGALLVALRRPRRASREKLGG